jgi:hypothetical protein
MFFRKKPVKVLCQGCIDPFLAEKDNCVPTADYGNLCQVCYELLRTIREDLYWVTLAKRFVTHPLSADRTCTCLSCKPEVIPNPKPYGLPDGYSE